MLLNWFKKLLKKNKKDYKPKTFEEAVDLVCDQIDQNDTNQPPMFHLTKGISIRNNLGLWDKNSPLYQHMLERFQLCHADDTSALIANAAYAKKNHKNYDPSHDVQKFKQHWNNMGLNPTTMKPLDFD